jgi:hypothetical protein
LSDPERVPSPTYPLAKCQFCFRFHACIMTGFVYCVKPRKYRQSRCCCAVP